MSDDGIDWSDEPQPGTEVDEHKTSTEPPEDGGDGDDSTRLDDVREGFASSDIDRPQPDYSRLGSFGASFISLIPKPLLGIRGTMYKRLAKKSIQNYHKTAGGDALAINAKAGQQVELEPVLYRTPEEVDEGEKPGWKVKGRDKVWNPGKEGNSVNYLGKTPTVLLEDDEHVEAGWLAPRIGTAIEMDNWWPLFNVDTINAVIDAGAAGNGQARADGGQAISFELDDPGEWAADNIIDLNSGDGYNGMRISTAKAREWQAEHTDSEHMQMQEDRGFLRGLANNDSTDAKRIFLYATLLVLGVLAIVLLGPKLIGSGGGASGINPLFALPTGL